MHVLNVALGGSLIPWLPDVVAHERHAGAKHTVIISVSSKIGKAVGDRIEVNAPHHQAVKKLGQGLIAVAWGDDQIVEWCRTPGTPLLRGRPVASGARRRQSHRGVPDRGGTPLLTNVSGRMCPDRTGIVR